MSECSGGGPETAEHRLAKELIADHLDRWEFIEACPNCQGRVRALRFRSSGGHSAKIEYPFEGFFIDVMALRGETAVAAIEVHQTHAVDEAKMAFFAERNIPVLEVEATEVIRAHDNGSFRVSFSSRHSCKYCQEQERRRNRRPCLDCSSWRDRTELVVIPAPPGHKYKTAFLCDDCAETCSVCEVVTPRSQMENSSRCPSCKWKAKSWRLAVVAAIKISDLKELRSLVENPPDSLGDAELPRARLELQRLTAQHAEHEHQRLVLRQQREEESRVRRNAAELIRWREQIEQSIQNQDIEKIERLIKSGPRELDQEEIERAYSELERLRQLQKQKRDEAEREARLEATREEERQRTQQRERARAHNIALRKAAQDMVAANRVNLSVNIAEKDQARRCGALWDADARQWYVEPRLAGRCARWLRDANALVPLIESQLKERTAAKKRERQQEADPAARRVTDFFKRQAAGQNLTDPSHGQNVRDLLADPQIPGPDAAPIAGLLRADLTALDASGSGSD